MYIRIRSQHGDAPFTYFDFSQQPEPLPAKERLASGVVGNGVTIDVEQAADIIRTLAECDLPEADREHKEAIEDRL
ncbi:MAG: hypothetical protein IMW98_09615, partial [Firmicutes bacterium]|nr:hypothetical protein [Bacillota bacterium]